MAAFYHGVAVGYPVVDEAGHLLGLVTKADLLEEWMLSLVDGDGTNTEHPSPTITFDLVNQAPITVSLDETCRTAAERMVYAGIGRLLVVSATAPDRVIGIVTRSDLLKSRSRHTDEEVRRERFWGAPGGRPVSGRG
jgi:CBS domain-containing protein